MTVQAPLFGNAVPAPMASHVEVRAKEARSKATFDVTKFVEHFRVLAEAEGGLKNLRELVLDLAVRGLLVPQVAAEGTSDGLVGDLAERRSKLASQARVRADLPEVTPEEQPFLVPKSWRWLRLGHFGAFLGGGTPAKSNVSFWDGPIPWVSPKDMKRPYIDDAEDHISEAAVEGSAVKLIPPRSLLFVVRGMILAHSFPVAMTTKKVTINQDMKGLVLALPTTGEYLLRSCWAARTRVLQRVERSSHGTCRLESEAVEELPIPVPPVDEQKRIVAKVDELMRLLDDLEAKQTKKRETQARLRTAALDALTSAAGPVEFEAAWKSVVETFAVLFERADGVGDLRGAIRNLAIMGMLSTRQAGERPAEVLLEQVSEERERRVRTGELRRTDPVPVVAPDDAAFPLPTSWSWTRLGSLCFKVADGPHFSPKYVSRDEGVPFLSGRNIKVDGFELESVKFVSPKDHATFIARAKPELGDVLYTKGGTTGVALVNTLKFEFSVWVHVAILRLDQAHVFPHYVALALNSPHCYAQSQKLTHGIGNRDLGLTRMVMITIPLPPLQEQKRIVAKVEHLLKLCDDLEAKLHRAETTAAKLIEATVAEMVGA